MKLLPVAVAAAALTLAPTIVEARAAQPDDYSMTCFPIRPGMDIGTCLERSPDGSSTWYWYDANGGWGPLDDLR